MRPPHTTAATTTDFVCRKATCRICISDMSSLQEWLSREPVGALTRLWRDSTVSWHTVNRAKNGEKVGLRVAMLISRATRYEVPVSELSDDGSLIEQHREDAPIYSAQNQQRRRAARR